MRNDDAFHRFQSVDDLVADSHGIRSRLFGYRQCDCRIAPAALIGARARHERHVGIGCLGACRDVGDIVQIDRLAVVHTDDQLIDFVRRGQKRTGPHRNLLIVVDLNKLLTEEEWSEMSMF